MNPAEVRDSLIKISKAYSLSSTEVAAMLGYSPATTSRWWRKKSVPSLYQTYDWAEALGFELTLVRRPEKKEYATRFVPAKK